MGKQTICILAKTKAQIRFAVTTKLISVFVFAILILQNAEVCGKTPGQEREPKLLRLTGPLKNSKGSL